MVMLGFVPVAHAATSVPGTVSTTQPLQPAPAGIEPNISHNVNSVNNADVLPEDVAIPED